MEEAMMKVPDGQRWLSVMLVLVLVGCGDCGTDEDDSYDGDCPCVTDSDCPGTFACSADFCVPRSSLDAGTTDGGLDADIQFLDGGADADTSRDIDGPDLPPNECGGTAELVWMGTSAVAGHPCGDCADGELVCDGADALGCEGTGDFNECGGCGELTERLGVPCGDCGVIWCEGGLAACVDDLGGDCPPQLSRSFRLQPSDADLGDGVENDRFGWTVEALTDGGILVGAPEDDTAAVAGGRMFE
jgi:hypothetical protein